MYASLPEGYFSVETIPYPGYPIREGSEGGEVREIQKYLGKIAAVYGEIPAPEETGVFGAATTASVRAYQALFGIPDDFAGKMLEVPVGTGVLTMPVYAALPEADVTCLDYSEDMLNAAKEKAEHMNLRNVRFEQGDVGALPFEDESFDIVLSLNGFHAFPDKEAAYRETFRVLKKGGTFCGCFSVKGGCARTDWFISHLYQPKGFFTPPYETAESLRIRLSGLYREADVTMVEGIGCFRCRK
jgi:ubiquinone/menaquinone biosynthesis C-methylase UbiE